jgi:hypothetical protein
MENFKSLFQVVLTLILNSGCIFYVSQNEEGPVTMEEIHSLPPLAIEDVLNAINDISEKNPEIPLNSVRFSRLLYNALISAHTNKDYTTIITDQELWLLVNASDLAWPTYWAGEDAKARARAMFPAAYDMGKDKVDAFRHSYWNILISLRIKDPYVEGIGSISSVEWAELYTTAHEGDSASWETDEKILDCSMDLHNNDQGRRLYLSHYTGEERSSWEQYFEFVLFDYSYKRISNVGEISQNALVFIECTYPNDSEIEGCDDQTIIDPPIDPCASVTSGNGYYCGSDDELKDYPGNGDDLVYCVNGMTISVEYCENGCEENDPTLDAYCLPAGCTPVCNPGQTRCNGNSVEVCSADRCDYVFSYSCSANQTCANGSCSTVTAPAPVINSVSCTSYQRGSTNVTCTIHGSNFDCGAGSNTFVGELYNGPAQSCTSTQLVVSGSWPCNSLLGFKQVSHRNPDNQRDDKYNLVQTVMGELKITSVWQQTVHQGAINVSMGANGCNFGDTVVFWAGGIQISNTHLQAQDQVLATGTVTGTTTDSPVDVCVAKYAGAQVGFDKKCWYDYINIIP